MCHALFRQPPRKTEWFLGILNPQWNYRQVRPLRHIPFVSVEPVFITGPTAAGKSGVALHLAQWINGEIISVDSMQVYRGLDIGTAKPTVAERSRVPHHLINVVEITAPFDVAQFVRLAQEAVVEIQSRGRCLIF